MNDESLMQKRVLSMGYLKCSGPRNVKDEGQKGPPRRHTSADRIFDGAYIVVTPANRQFTLSQRDVLKFKGFRESGYAHASSETAVSAYRAHCEDSGLPFVLVSHSQGHKGWVLGRNPPHSTVRLELPLGRKLSPSGQVAVFAEIASHSPWGESPACLADTCRERCRAPVRGRQCCGETLSPRKESDLAAGVEGIA